MQKHLHISEVASAIRKAKNRSLQDRMRAHLVSARVEAWRDDDLTIELPALPRTKTGRVRKTRPDFAWPEKRVALYCHGGTYVRGAHSRGPKQARDFETANELQLMGWIVIAADTDQTKGGEALRWVKRALEGR